MRRPDHEEGQERNYYGQVVETAPKLGVNEVPQESYCTEIAAGTLHSVARRCGPSVRLSPECP